MQKKPSFLAKEKKKINCKKRKKSENIGLEIPSDSKSRKYSTLICGDSTKTSAMPNEQKPTDLMRDPFVRMRPAVFY